MFSFSWFRNIIINNEAEVFYLAVIPDNGFEPKQLIKEFDDWNLNNMNRGSFDIKYIGYIKWKKVFDLVESNQNLYPQTFENFNYNKDQIFEMV